MAKRLISTIVALAIFAVPATANADNYLSVNEAKRATMREFSDPGYTWAGCKRRIAGSYLHCEVHEKEWVEIIYEDTGRVDRVEANSFWQVDVYLVRGKIRVVGPDASDAELIAFDRFIHRLERRLREELRWRKAIQ